MDIFHAIDRMLMTSAQSFARMVEDASETRPEREELDDADDWLDDRIDREAVAHFERNEEPLL